MSTGNSTLLYAVNRPPPAPSHFRVTSNRSTNYNYSIMFRWDHEKPNIVENYTVTVSPAPLSEPAMSEVTSRSWRITLAYFTVYSIEILAVNCGGNSTPIRNSISYSK